MRTSNRRDFLKTFAGGMASTPVVPSIFPREYSTDPAAIEQLRRAIYHGQDDEDFWKLVKKQFPLRDDLIIMNAANLCPSPRPVIDAVIRLTSDVDADASFQNRAQFGELRETARKGLAAFLAADADEIAITRNTSEGNNTVINGLSLGAGDEIVIWNQNHPTNNVAWDVRSERYGFTVNRVATPPHPANSEVLFDAFERAITTATRVLAFSHVSNISGVGLPVKELCAMARERGILTLIDGAQTFGAVPVNLHDIGCDFYTGSAHKWFVGPKETGVLYVRRERVDDLWPSDVGVGWETALRTGARKFETLGQRDDAAISAVGTAIEFHKAIGENRVGRRVRLLAGTLKHMLQERIPGVTLHTPVDPTMSAGEVVFAIPGTNARELFGKLYEEHHIAGAAMRGDFEGVRFCPHIYNTMEEIERAVAVIASAV